MILFFCPESPVSFIFNKMFKHSCLLSRFTTSDKKEPDRTFDSLLGNLTSYSSMFYFHVSTGDGVAKLLATRGKDAPPPVPMTTFPEQASRGGLRAPTHTFGRPCRGPMVLRTAAAFPGFVVSTPLPGNKICREECDLVNYPKGR